MTNGQAGICIAQVIDMPRWNSFQEEGVSTPAETASYGQNGQEPQKTRHKTVLTRRRAPFICLIRREIGILSSHNISSVCDDQSNNHAENDQRIRTGIGELLKTVLSGARSLDFLISATCLEFGRSIGQQVLTSLDVPQLPRRRQDAFPWFQGTNAERLQPGEPS